MTYSFSKIRECIDVQSIEEFKSLLQKVTPHFFKVKFEKSKKEYVEEIYRLFEQIDSDFHFVWVLKQEKYAFQLRWKESVLRAHLSLLLEVFPDENILKKAV